MEKINGKVYPMWQQFLDKKDQWIGGILEDSGDSMDRQMGLVDESAKTEITDMKLEANGDNSAMFHVIGKGFSCGGDVGHLGITSGEEGWITFCGYGGHEFRIKKK